MKHTRASTLRKAGLRLAATLGVVGACSVSSPAFAQDRAEIDKTRITGNRELPKVLYIVPWRKPEPGELAARPLHSVIDEALAPLDRDVVRREQQYGAQVRRPAEPKSDAAGKP
jgi:hypothetical protein